MFRTLLAALRASLRSRRDLALENLALRQQLALLARTRRRPRARRHDRIFWLILRQVWARWREPIRVFTPATVLRWHWSTFSWIWTARSQRRGGRPRIQRRVVALIREIAGANPTWGAPRIHGEL